MHSFDRHKQLAGNYLNLLSVLPYPIAVFRAVDGCLLAANRRLFNYMKLHGEEIAGMVGTGFSDFTTGLRGKGAFSDLLRMRVIENGVIQFESPNGFRSQIKADVQPVRYSGQDCWLVTATVETGQNLSAKKDPKEEESYRALVENLNDIVYTTDKNAVVTYVSPNIYQLSGYEPCEVIGKCFTDFVRSEERV